MDSTNSAQHQFSPSSLPSDYALLSRYAQNLPSPPSNDDYIPENLSRPRLTQAPSLNHPLDRGSLAVKNGRPTEASPLLPSPPPFPYIEEDVDRDDSLDNRSLCTYFSITHFASHRPSYLRSTHLLEYSLVVASVVSIGHLSTKALAAITLGSMTASVSGFSIIQGLSSALDTLLPSAWTSPHPNLVGLWSQRMFVVISACLVPMYIVWFNAEAILIALKQDPEVAHLAAVYLHWVSIGLPAYAFNCVSRRYFQSQNLFSVPTRIIIFVSPLNVILNYILVWGPEPVRLGFIGAPLATAVSFNLVAILSIIYGVFFTPKTAWYPFSRRMFTSLGVVAQLGVSGVGQVASEWWAWELISLGASLLGPVALATQSVLLVSSSTTFQVPFAISVATSVRIGNLLGEHKANRARVAAITSLFLTLCVAALMSTMFIVFRNSWAYIFNNDPEVVSLVASIMPLVALFQVFDGTAAVTGGILRAQGKQLSGAVLNLSAYYVIGIPLGMLLAFKYNMGLHGLWYGLTVSLVYCAVAGTWLALKTDWQHQVDKVQRRLAAEREANMKAGGLEAAEDATE
ncbi:hypothetical protein Agabi119p4_9736 [Agaricus bisporus var. burnettii]|uniref:MATE efflux family protein n=1 Tax=Agaricus bisporus var. burnettii TaxID=192524 RepID=A0A8H7C2Z3_AGABI|nr:hypothetical protein Agabi119p4_9736 [Agaricus bisporus var. burnettii]